MSAGSTPTEPVRFDRPHPNLSLSTAKLVEALRHGEPGDSFSDAELAGIAGVGLATGADRRHLHAKVRSAIRIVEREYQVVWSRPHGEHRIAVPGVDGVITEAAASARGIRRKAERTTRRLGCASLEGATAEQRKQVMNQMTHFAAMATLSRLSAPQRPIRSAGPSAKEIAGELLES